MCFVVVMFRSFQFAVLCSVHHVPLQLLRQVRHNADALTEVVHPVRTEAGQTLSQGNKPVQVQSESAAVVPIGPSLAGKVRLIGRAPAARSHTYGTINNGWLD